VHGIPAQGETTSSFDHAHASCGDEAKGPDAAYKLDVAQRSRARIVEHSDDFAPVLHVRRACTDFSSEIGCANTGATDEDVAYVGMLDPGTYAVFADGSDHEAVGRYTLLAELASEQGGGAQGDACVDALGLSSQSDRGVVGDTFLARDDFAGKCGGTGAADVVYKVDIRSRSRIGARFTRQEGRHLFVLMRTCGDRGTEIACGPSLDEILAPGTYYLAVDGARADAFGKFTFDWRVREIASQESTCRGAPLLAEGSTSGTTTGAADRFTTSCGGREDAQSSPERMYRIVLAKRTHVRLSLTTPSWDGVLAVRKTCLEPLGSSGARAAEVACNNDESDTHHSRIDATLDPGTYFVQVDGHAGGNEGPFTLDYRILR
jgi:hypothetical protein